MDIAITNLLNSAVQLGGVVLNESVSCRLTQLNIEIELEEDVASSEPNQVKFNLPQVEESFEISINIFSDPEMTISFDPSLKVDKNSFLYLSSILDTKATSFYVVVRKFWASGVKSAIADPLVIMIDD